MPKTHPVSRIAQLFASRPAFPAIALGAGLTLAGCGSDPAEPAATAQNAAANTEQPSENATDAEGRTVVKPEQLVLAARKLRTQNQAGKAVQLLSLAIKAKPKLAAAYVERAAILADSRLYIKAIKDMDRAVELAPGRAPLLTTRGYFHLQQQAYQKALADFNAAIEADPEFAVALNNRGLVHVALEQHAAAVRDFDAALNVKPDYADARNNRGFAHMQTEQFDKALADFSQVVKDDPKYVSAYNNRGMVNARTENFDEAIVDFTNAIKLAPTQVKLYLHRSQAYEEAGQPELAKKDVAQVVWLQKLGALNRKVAADSRSVKNLLARSRHLADGGQMNAALADTERAIKAAPSAPEPVTGKAEILFRAGKYPEAAAVCDESLAKGPLNQTYSIRGDIRMKTGDYDGAIADYTAAKRFDAEVAQAYVMRAKQYEANGEIQQASADMKQAAALDSSIQLQ